MKYVYYQHLYSSQIVSSSTGKYEEPQWGYEPRLAETLSLQSQPKDEETGYGYFGARYMDHELMTMWLSVDPMSDKYLGINPYAYCAWTRPTGGDEHRLIEFNIVNNPVKLVDPNGRDVWEIDSRGYIVSRTDDKTQDAFFMVDKNGNRITGKELVFNYGTIENAQSQYHDQSKRVFDWYQVRGDKNGKELFEFLASNTNVEWSNLVMGQEGGKGLNIVCSSHQKTTEGASSFLYKNKNKYGYTLRISRHSHPSNTPYPSGLEDKTADIGFAKMVTCNSQKYDTSLPYFEIFLPGPSKYVSYNANSKSKDFGLQIPSITLKEVTVNYPK